MRAADRQPRPRRRPRGDRARCTDALESPTPAAVAPRCASALPLAPVAVLGDDELLGQRDARRRRRVGDHRDRLGHRGRERDLLAAELDRDLLVARGHERALEPRLDAAIVEVVQELLGLVLEAQDPDRRAGLAVGERHAVDAAAGVDRMAVRARLGVADGGEHPLLEHRRHRVLDPLRLLVHLVPRDPEHVGEEALDHPVAAHDVLGVLAAGVGEGQRAVGPARDVAVALEPPDHLVDGRRGQLHGPGDVGAGHRQPRLVEPEDGLEVLLLGDGGLGLGGHVLDPSPAPPSASRPAP